jgi:YidC/Oxa1 family membrane protein insertase
MDRNTIIGFVLIFAIVFTWMTFNSRDTSEQQRVVKEKAMRDSIADLREKTEKEKSVVDTAGTAFRALPDSTQKLLKAEMQTSQWGDFYPLTQGTDDTVHVSTDMMDLRINSKGGMIAPIYLKQFVTYDKKPLPIITEDSVNKLFLVLFHKKTTSGVVETRNFFFKKSVAEKIVNLKGEKTQKISMRAELNPNSYIEYVYTFYGNTYDIGFEVNLVGMKDYISDGHYLMKWEEAIPKTEKAITLMVDKAGINYKFGGEYSWMNPKAPQTIDMKDDIEWISYRSQFFAHTLICKGDRPDFGVIKQVTPKAAIEGYGGNDPGKVVALMGTELDIRLSGQATENNKFAFYAGPLDLSILRAYDNDMDRQVGLGWGPLRWINRLIIIPVFKFLEGTIGNYGIIIFILAVLIKLIVFPFTHKTYLSSAKMRLINQMPEVKELDVKFKDDMMKANQAKMGIYRQFGVNPMGGCLPMLLQYPVLVSMFMFFPNSLELRQQGFLWADDLSTYDSIANFDFWIPLYGDHVSLFTLLMTISIYLFTFVQQRQQPQMNSNAMLKYMPYFMPILFLGFLNNYSAGLSYYYFLSNMLSIAQTQITKRFVSDESLLDQMRMQQKERAKGTGKGRLETWADRQKEKQAEMQKARKKKK